MNVTISDELSTISVTDFEGDPEEIIQKFKSIIRALGYPEKVIDRYFE